MRENEGMEKSPFQSPNASTQAPATKAKRDDPTWAEMFLFIAVAGVVAAAMSWYLNIHRIFIYAVALGLAYLALIAKRRVFGRVPHA